MNVFTAVQRVTATLLRNIVQIINRHMCWGKESYSRCGNGIIRYILSIAPLIWPRLVWNQEENITWQEYFFVERSIHSTSLSAARQQCAMRDKFSSINSSHDATTSFTPGLQNVLLSETLWMQHCMSIWAKQMLESHFCVACPAPTRELFPRNCHGNLEAKKELFSAEETQMRNWGRLRRQKATGSSNLAAH